MGTGNLESQVSCVGENVPPTATYEIACGNGTNAVMNPDGKSGKCSYTNDEPLDSKTFAPRCTIKVAGSSYTSNACTKNVGVNPDPNNQYNLSLKKYVDTVSPGTDANTDATAINKVRGNTFDYQIRVTNQGTGTVSSGTTVTDTLPSNISFAGDVTGSGWECTQKDRSLNCMRYDRLEKGASFPDIRVPVRVASDAPLSTVITNTATVTNPGDKDTSDNSDPAKIKVTERPQLCGSSIGTITGAITATSPNLCAQGSVTGFGQKQVGNRIDYAWSCVIGGTTT